jgi:HSP20 family protein
MSVNLATELPYGNVARQMGKLMDQLQRGYYNYAPPELWTPSVNLYETETAYLVCVDLAGVEKEKIDIAVDDHLLKLHGKRAVPAMEPEQAGNSKIRVHLMEIDHGWFSREVDLPRNVLREKISARYQSGLLWVELPKG